MRGLSLRNNQRGSTLLEFAIGATVFMTAVFGVLEFGRLLWTHNALADAARRGARYAVTHGTASEENVKNVVVYGTEEAGTQPRIPGLDTGKVEVVYEGGTSGLPYGVGQGTATVSIEGFAFQFVVPHFGASLQMPAYKTTLTAESAGTDGSAPAPTATPGPSATPTPTTTPTPAPTATPAPSATPTPSPTPRSCSHGERPESGCVCTPPMSVNPSGKCM
jgi:hypothetical protein